MTSSAATGRFIVVRNGPPASQPWTVGDSVSTYELEHEYTFRSPVDRDWTYQPHGGVAVDLHEMARYKAAEVKGVDGSTVVWRELKDRRRFCVCRERRLLVTVFVEPGTSILWCLVQPERVPAAFRKGPPASAEAWPYHQNPNGTPHVGVVTCQRCRRLWAYFIYLDDVDLVPIARVVHGGELAE